VGCVTAGLFSLTVELSYLHHTPWIDGLREIRLAALLLGHGFLWNDLVCYGVDVGIGVLAEALSARRQPSANRRLVSSKT
jgi:hypothetical protein